MTLFFFFLFEGISNMNKKYTINIFSRDTMYTKTVIKMNFVDILLNKKESLNGKTAFIPCPPNFKLKAFFLS